MASAWENLFGQEGKFTNVPKYNPEIQGYLNNLIKNQFQNVQGGHGKSPAFQQQKQQLTNEFHNEVVPTIANRFLAGNTGNSSAFQSALGSAGSELQQGLGALEQQYGQQQLQNLMALLGLGQEEQIYQPESYGLLGNLAQGGLQLGGAYLSGLNNPGKNALSLLSSLFSGRNNTNSGNNEMQLPQLTQQNQQPTLGNNSNRQQPLDESHINQIAKFLGNYNNINPATNAYNSVANNQLNKYGQNKGLMSLLGGIA